MSQRVRSAYVFNPMLLVWSLFAQSTSASDTNTACQQARRRLKEIGLNLLTSTGESIIHMCVTPAMVHVAASVRVNINAQNFVSTTRLFRERHMSS